MLELHIIHPSEVEIPIEVPFNFCRKYLQKKNERPSKATKEAEKQAKRALEEEEALVEENLVELLARGRKDLRNKHFFYNINFINI